MDEHISSINCSQPLIKAFCAFQFAIDSKTENPNHSETASLSSASEFSLKSIEVDLLPNKKIEILRLINLPQTHEWRNLLQFAVISSEQLEITGVHFHDFVLTDTQASKSYCSCMQVPGYVLYDQDSPPGSIDLSKKYLAVFCFVSPRPIHFTLRKCLRELYARSFEKTGSCGPEFIWNLFHNVLLPPPGNTSISFHLEKINHHVTLTYYGDNGPLGLLFYCLGIGNIVYIVNSLLLEKSIILVSSNISRLTIFFEALFTLIRPLEWQHVYLPILLPSLVEMLEAPTPFLAGATRELIQEVNLTAGTIVVDIDNDSILFGELIPLIPHQSILIKKLKEIVYPILGQFFVPENNNQPQEVINGILLESDSTALNIPNLPPNIEADFSNKIRKVFHETIGYCLQRSKLSALFEESENLIETIANYVSKFSQENQEFLKAFAMTNSLDLFVQVEKRLQLSQKPHNQIQFQLQKLPDPIKNNTVFDPLSDGAQMFISDEYISKQLTGTQSPYTSLLQFFDKMSIHNLDLNLMKVTSLFLCGNNLSALKQLSHIESETLSQAKQIIDVIPSNDLQALQNEKLSSNIQSYIKERIAKFEQILNNTEKEFGVDISGDSDAPLLVNAPLASVPLTKSCLNPTPKDRFLVTDPVELSQLLVSTLIQILIDKTPQEHIHRTKQGVRIINSSILKHKSKSALYQEYCDLACNLQNVDLKMLLKDVDARICFFLNVRNSLSLHIILKHGLPLTYAEKVFQVNNSYGYSIGGHFFTLSDITYGILRASMHMPNVGFGVFRQVLFSKFSSHDPRAEYGIPIPIPLITFTLFDYSSTGPRFRCFSTDNLREQMKEEAIFYLSSGEKVVIDTKSKKVKLTSTFQWLLKDFEEAKTATELVLYFFSHFPESILSKYLQQNGQTTQSKRLEGKVTVEFVNLDLSFLIEMPNQDVQHLLEAYDLENELSNFF